MKLTARDLIFSALNGLFIGILAPFVFANLGYALPISRLLFAILLMILSVIGVTVGYVLSKKIAFFFQLAKFGLVGVTNTVIDAGITNLFIWVTSYTVGNAILFFKVVSVSSAIINSYIWNKHWSFAKQSPDEASAEKEFAQFVGVSVIGLLLNTAITYIFINVIGAPEGFNPTKWASIGSIAAPVFVLAWNFIGYKFFVFKR